MRQADLIHRQAELVAVTIGSRVRRLYDALDGMVFMTRQVLATEPADPAALAAWVRDQGLEVLDSGFFANPATVARAAAAGSLPGEGLCVWRATLRDDVEIQRHARALWRVMPHAASMQQRFKGIPWAYFQAARSPHFSVVTPCLVPDAMIPSDFDWHTYHSFTIAEPGANPARETRWSPPNIDYAGQGLISCVSAPVYEGDAFLGVWTMDVRLADLHADLALETLGRIGARQTNFLADHDGRLLAHPSLGPDAQGEKGAVYNVRLASLGGDYATLDLAALIAQGHGQTEVIDAAGVRHVLVFRTVPEIRWVVFASFPAADLVEATQAAFQQAFAHLGAGDLTARLDAVGDETMQRLAASFNEMTATLQESLRRREQAEAERRRLAAEQERMARELEIAASIQLAMLPRAPVHPAFEFAGQMQPAEEVGGDFYDVITRGDGLWITVGDVSSHGLGSGLVMMLAQTAFRTVFEAAPDLPADEAVRRVNRLVHANSNAALGGARYITAQLVAWRGGRCFDLAGGHLWPLAIDTVTREVRRIEAPGPWLGIVADLPMVPVTRLELRESEVLCLYSDGIIEARDASGAMYDLARLGERLGALLGEGRDLASCAVAVLAEVDAFSAERDDDRTLLLVRPRAGGGSVSP
ncbi:MAG: SpoIIE family protein phosphatase [Polyangiales bacterium]